MNLYQYLCFQVFGRWFDEKTALELVDIDKNTIKVISPIEDNAVLDMFPSLRFFGNGKKHYTKLREMIEHTHAWFEKQMKKNMVSYYRVT